MKKIEATISPFLLEPVKDGLKEIGLSGITVSEVQDFLLSRDGDTPSAFTPRLMLEVVVPDVVCDDAISAIRQRGCIDGTPYAFVHVINLADVVRIRTAEHGEAAI